jgi:hypothetical protein
MSVSGFLNKEGFKLLLQRQLAGAMAGRVYNLLIFVLSLQQSNWIQPLIKVPSCFTNAGEHLQVPATNMSSRRRLGCCWILSPSLFTLKRR